MILDTNFLIQFARELQAKQKGPARTFLAANRARPVFISVISLGELAAGLEDNEASRRFCARFGRTLNLFPEQALVAAQIDRVMMSKGLRLGENDNWIAGAARYYGQPIVSNDKAFDSVPGLRRISY